MTVTTHKVLKRFHKSLVRPHMDNLEKLETKTDSLLRKFADSPVTVMAIAFVVVVGLLFWVAFK